MPQTVLHAVHKGLGAKFTPFAGWDMPLRYTSEIAEHHAVRQAAGLFDLSHMGQVWVTGPAAAKALDFALTGNISAIAVGGAKYTMLCHENGGILDDLVVYRLAEERFLVVANAASISVVLQAFDERGVPAVLAADQALIAIQGPHAATMLATLTGMPLPSLRYYAAMTGEVATRPVIVARTGYTGEDGFEIYCDGADAVHLWTYLNAVGAQPAGLACRDTLRLEAGMPLYGNELHLGVTPFDAGLGRVVDFGKPDGFVGMAALTGLAEKSPQRTLAGLVSAGRRVARPGHRIVSLQTGAELGVVTSGCPSPTLGKPIALGYLDAERGSEVGIDIRGAIEHFTVTEPRFYRRSR